MTTSTPLDHEADLGAAIARILGFTPTESLVLIPTTADGMAARVDLDPLMATPNHPVIGRIAAALADAGVRDVVVAYFTTANPAALSDIDGALTQQCDAVHITRMRTLLIDTPPQGPTRGDLARIQPDEASARARATHAFRGTAPDLASYLRAIRRLEDGRSISATLIGRSATALTSVHLRDAIVVHMTGTELEDPEHLATSGPSDDIAAAALNTIMRHGPTNRPNGRAHAHASLLTAIVAHLPNRDHAPARTLLALLAWWEGDGASANRHLEEALTVAPTYRLALLVRACLADAAATH